jgi:uncharacterized protein (TIGR02452 family)
VRIAEETLAIIDAGSYRLDDGRTVDLADAQAAATSGTLLFTPDAIATLTLSDPGSSEMGAPAIEVRNCTTFAAARDLLADDPDADVLCLNFASALTPGGGFLGGSQAQEEALCRASGLYPTLLTQPAYYERNRVFPSALYTDHIMYSPRVPVFRDDDDRLIADPYSVSIATAPAPNAGAIRQNEPEAVAELGPTMLRRILAVLSVAVDRDHRALVLGAWGCGVFGNDPAEVAGMFREALTTTPFATAFDRVVFAVLDFSADLGTFQPFRETFRDPFLA